MRARPFRLIAIGLSAAVLWVCLFGCGNAHFPFSGRQERAWSIGIYEGRSPFDVVPATGITNPVLTGKDVVGRRVRSVSDPFVVVTGLNYFMFFEAYDIDADQGDIGLATSIDGRRWTYKQIVIDEPFHLSYPYVFAWNGDFYLIPESAQDSSIRLYKARRFPDNWEFVTRIISGAKFLDSSILRFNDTWWLFTATGPDNLRLFYADDLTGPWHEHPQSPIVQQNPHQARPAGRVLVTNGRPHRFAQDDYPSYGIQVFAFEITELTTASYRERPVREKPILQASGNGWNKWGMHQLDPYRGQGTGWLACVDGWGNWTQ